MSDPDTTTHPNTLKRPHPEPSSPTGGAQALDDEQDQHPRRRTRIEAPVTENIVNPSPSVAHPEENIPHPTHTDTFGFGYVAYADLTAEQIQFVDEHWYDHFMVEWIDKEDSVQLVDPAKTVIDLGLGRVQGMVAAREYIKCYPAAQDAMRTFLKAYDNLEYYYNACTHYAWSMPPPPVPRRAVPRSIPRPLVASIPPPVDPPDVSDKPPPPNVLFTPRKMPRQEYREYLGDKLDDFDHIWKYISNGNKFSEEFGPGKIICLLLQDLGKDEKIAEQAKELFNKSNAITLYINSPGSGKSATLFTGLTENWGFYFSFADERRDAQTYGYGSRDLSVLLEMMPNHSEWKQATTQAQFEANKKIVQRCIGMLIVVRLAVLLRFLDSVPEDWDPALVRLQWLFIQAAPNLVADGTQPNDIFRALIEALRITTGPDARAVDDHDCVFIARQLWTIIIKKHARLFPVDNLNKRTLWMAVDEAQRAVQEFLDRFCSDRDPNVRRPILAVIQKIVRDDYDMVTNVVYSGTGLSMRFAQEALSSSALKAGNIFTKNRAGVFDEAEQLGATLSRADLDEIAAVAAAVNWDLVLKLAREDEHFMSALLSATLRYGIASFPSIIHPKHAELIESGIAYIKQNSEDTRDGGSVGPVAMDEPVALGNVLMRCTGNIVTWMNDLRTQALNNVEQGYRLQMEFALLMMHHFGGKYTKLIRVFKVGGYWAELADKEFTLVGVIKRNGKSLSFSTSWTKAPNLPFGFTARNAEALAKAVESGRGFSWFWLDNNARPDWLCVLEEKETKAKTIMFAQMKWSDGQYSKKLGEFVLNPETFLSAVESVEPDNIYSRTDKDGNKTFSTPVMRARVLAALNEMVNAERGDVDELPSSEPEWLAAEGPAEQCVPTAERSHGTRGATGPSLKTPDDNHGIPRFMRTLVTGPIATPLFQSEGDRAHKFPLMNVRDTCMAGLFGDQWYDWSKSSYALDPRNSVREHFFSSDPASDAVGV
ncbi:uncharacterized protein STEHIDRAFT_162125 [Stereum hirsutum FP-91666 SS1]|uniref:uncharacterized protein n=1 Tax=Stereum hirsutum (strain FP-91666) TaxID=721885 RepID=UPI0004449B42|nr:uncharacterized protein STEHIDRAFT_162125 [Stereum hirsutum FP-91666 SS1]EIM81132.1 hypothetical protein STEHIDRAFT_162125 [Stereum hirsutum FP-91666 SS1]